MAETNTEQKQKVEITWLQCQLPRSEWDSLNARRLALKLTWADIIMPGTKKYLDYFEATRAQQADTTKEAPAPPVVDKGSDEKKDASKSTKTPEAKARQPQTEPKPRVKKVRKAPAVKVEPRESKER
jgi:outer membrane biosynthesis protein TonB